jgi:ubiquinone/menaquinone biosynthesis C-methylase UbiE
MTAAYDAIAEWYEEYVTGPATGYSDAVAAMLADLLPTGSGQLCLDVCCGTGARAETIARRGWRPVGFDLSAGQLGYAAGREPVVRAHAAALPVRDASVDAAVCVLAHTDVDDYAAVLRETARVLRPGATFVHIGVHPCFCGYFADLSDPLRLVISPGYTSRVHSYEAWSPHGVRARVGAWHLTMADLVNATVAAGLSIRRMVEAHGDAPQILGFAATKTAATKTAATKTAATKTPATKDQA